MCEAQRWLEGEGQGFGGGGGMNPHGGCRKIASDGSDSPCNAPVHLFCNVMDAGKGSNPQDVGDRPGSGQERVHCMLDKESMQ